MPTTQTADQILNLFRAAVQPLVTVGLDITHGVINQPEQFGEPCDHCTTEPLFPVVMNVYMTSLATGEGVMLSGCAGCMVVAVAADADPDATVQIETQETPR